MRRLLGCLLVVSAFAGSLLGADPVEERLRYWEAWKRREAGRPEVAPPPRQIAARFEAVLIGLNRLDPRAYGGDYPLRSAEADAHALDKALRDRGATTTSLLGGEATLRTVAGQLRESIGRLTERDTLWVHFSGLVTTVPDANGDEPSGLDRAWCLRDGLLLDDELNSLLAGAPAGSSVVVTVDGGAGGSAEADLVALRGIIAGRSEGEVGLRSALKQRLAEAAEGRSRELLARRLPEAARAVMLKAQGTFYEQVQKAIPRETAAGSTLAARVLVMHAARPTESVPELSEAGLLTMALTRGLGRSGKNTSYEELFKGLSADYAEIGLTIRPQAIPLGKEASGALSRTLP